MKKKIISLILAALILVVLLIPVPLRLKDGGTVVWQAVLYSVSDVHSLALEEDVQNGKLFYEGIIIKILGFEVFNNVK